MFLITGLGNPGKQYENTPHNSGYIFLDSLKDYLIQDCKLEISDWKDERKIFFSEICRVKINGELIGILQKPLTFMNNSGDAVKSVLKKFDVDEYILIHDDLDIPLGKYKIQMGKSPKGHKGILSVENILGGKEFLRVRMGIENRGDRLIPGEEYVLIPYSKKERAILDSTVEDAVCELSTEYLQV